MGLIIKMVTHAELSKQDVFAIVWKKSQNRLKVPTSLVHIVPCIPVNPWHADYILFWCLKDDDMSSLLKVWLVFL